MAANGEGSREAQFRNQLLATLKDKGLDDMLKKELRTKILEQLKNPHHSKSADSDSLFTRVMASLVAEYLTLHGLSYSHSVFLPDVGYEGKTLSRPELKTLFSIEAGSVGEESSLLEYFCGLQLPGSAPNCSYGCQTSEFEVGYTLEQRIELIDQKHAFLHSQQPRTQQSDPSLLRKELEVELKQHYDRELRRFKEFELETVRLEEFERARKRTDEMKSRLEETYRRKCEDLRKRERRLLDEHEHKLRQLDLQRSQHEDSMKKERELLQLRHRAANEHAKLSNSERQVQQDKYRRLQDELQHKISEYDRLNSKAADTIKYEVNLVKLAMQKEYQDKEMLTLEHKKAVDEEYYKMMSIKDSVETITRQNSRLVEENRELRREVQDMRRQNQEIFDETKQNVQRAEHVREEKAELEKELMRTQAQLEKESARTQKLQHELTQARRQLDQARGQTEKLREDLEQAEQPNLNVPVPTPEKKESVADDLHRKMEELRRQRKKEIEKMRLQMLS